MSIWPITWPPAAENYLKMASLSIIISRGQVHTVLVRKLNFCMVNGFSLYLNNLKQFLRWGHSVPPLPTRGVSNMIYWWPCRILNERLWNIHFRKTNIMSIWPLTWPSAANNDLKTALSLNTYLVEGSTSTSFGWGGRIFVRAKFLPIFSKTKDMDISNLHDLNLLYSKINCIAFLKGFRLICDMAIHKSYFGVTTPNYAPYKGGGQSAPTLKIVSDAKI